MLTIHQLRVFVTVVETGSVRAAAERLLVTQPAVSASLAALEREVDAALFSRAGRGIELSEAGRTMERYARQLIGLVDETVVAVRDAQRALEATLRLAAVTAAEHLSSSLLALVHDLRPEMRIALEVGNRDRVWQLLMDRSVDLALGGRPPASGELVSLASHPNELVLVAKPGSVWNQKLGEATWLLRESGSDTRAATEEVMAELAVAPPTQSIGSNGAILAAAEAGLGVALLPRDGVSESLQLRRVAIVPSDATPLQRVWHLLARAGEALPAPARQFVEILVCHGGGFVESR